MQNVSDPIQRAQLRLGMVLSGKWRLDKVLGLGGVASVYLATHRNQGRVAIKILHTEQAQNTTIRERFVLEGYVANTIDHPGVVRILDDDIGDDGAPFLVMELLEGETLEDRAQRHGQKLPAGEVLVLADQLLDVLVAAHEKEILHRDLKPDNLFLTREGRLKVLDFGIARLAESVAERNITMIGMLMGTPSFMPPEQARSRWEDVDETSDLYAVGATMFTLLAGMPIREGETVPEQLALAINTRVLPLAQALPGVNPALADLVDRALAYEQSQRFPSARAMQAEVRRLIPLVPAPLTSSVLPAVTRVSASGATVADRPSAGAQAFTVRPITVSIERPLAAALVLALLGCLALAFWLLTPSEPTPVAAGAPLPSAAGSLTASAAAPLPSAVPAVNGELAPGAALGTGALPSAFLEAAQPPAAPSASAKTSPAVQWRPAPSKTTASVSPAPNPPVEDDPLSKRF